MKKLILLLTLSGIMCHAWAQEAEPEMIVRTATYFDKSPPMKEMKVILPGERDRSWKDGLVESNYLQELPGLPVQDLPAGFRDPVLQDWNGATKSRGPVLNFDGVSNVNGVFPPDTDGDVSPDHYFQMINLSYAIWDKDGVLLFGPVDNSTLWDGFIGPWTGTASRRGNLCSPP